MEIITPGKKIKKETYNICTCPTCNCQFKFKSDEIVGMSYDCGLHCPSCKEWIQFNLQGSTKNNVRYETVIETWELDQEGSKKRLLRVE